MPRGPDPVQAPQPHLLFHTTDKLCLNAAGGKAGFPLTVSTMQLGVCTLYALVLWVVSVNPIKLCGLQTPERMKVPKITKSDLVATLPVGFCSAVAHSAGVFCLGADPLFGQIVKAGEPVLAVPFWLCLVCEAEAPERQLASPWDTPHHDARDTLLARKLLQALEQDDAVPVEVRDFWQSWSEMLPARGSLAQGVALPPRLFGDAKYASELSSLVKHTPAALSVDALRQRLTAELGSGPSQPEALLVDLVARLLQYDPAARLSPAQALAHPFLAPLFPFGALVDREEAEVRDQRRRHLHVRRRPDA